MKTVGIIAAMDSELRALAQQTENVSVQTIAAMPYYTGTLCGVPVALCCCGVGKVNAAMHTNGSQGAAMNDSKKPCGSAIPPPSERSRR